MNDINKSFEDLLKIQELKDHITTFNNEKLSRYIENLKIEKAEAIQKYEELKRMFSELYQDAWWLYDWLIVSGVAYQPFHPKRAKFDELNKKWEFHE